MTEANEWPAQWLRGVLSLCVLRVVADHGPVHGYAITRELREQGLGTIGGGTLYPLLSRLESSALVQTDWIAGDGGPGKKVYVITDAGRESLATESVQWEQFAAVTTAHLKQGEKR